jgi:hypothetical protein
VEMKMNTCGRRHVLLVVCKLQGVRNMRKPFSAALSRLLTRPYPSYLQLALFSSGTREIVFRTSLHSMA